MTIQMFIGLFVFGAAVAILFTEALKKGWPNLAPNLLAFIVSIVVGGLGTVIVYILTDVVWDVKNIVCIPLMIFAVWIGAMVGYDKVIQLLSQLGKLKNK